MSVKKLFDLSGRVAVVTGGSRGLGLQMAEALGEMGARVVLTARKQDELDAAVAQLAKQKIDAAAWPCDIGKREAIAPVAEAILKKYGKVDILVNNAGATWGAPAEDHPLEAWDKLVSVNLSGAFALTQIIAKRSMIPARWGRIINIASIAGLSGAGADIQFIAYGTSKGAVVNFTRTLAGEWGPMGITVNALAPGFFPSKMTQGTLDHFGVDNLAARAPLRRIGDNDDLKGAALLFASAAGKHITGQILAVDGGVSAVHGG